MTAKVPFTVASKVIKCLITYQSYHLMQRADSLEEPDAGKDGGQKEKGATEGEMVGRHHRLDGHECEQAPGGGEGQGGLVRCSPWGSQRVGHNLAAERQQ